MRYKELLLAVLFMSSATTMRAYAAPDCAEILRYRGELATSIFVYNDSQAAVLADSMEIYSGANHTFVKMPDGRWQACGTNTSGQLSIGTTTNVLRPIRVTVPAGTKKIVGG